MFNILEQYVHKPSLYEQSTSDFWNDEYISKGMLEAHLNPDFDGATRNHQFVNNSVQWISSIAHPKQYKTLLDLGCGPGIYAEYFNQSGYCVTGIDFSQRSIKYAQEQSKKNNNSINYIYKDYLSIDYVNQFDVITLIWCDFGVFSTENRHILLKKIYQSLKPHGKFIFDVFTPHQYIQKQEQTSWEYHTSSSFWKPEPHLCLNSFFRYDEDNTVLNQTIVITEKTVECFNIWEHCFTKDSLIQELHAAGFTDIALYSDIAGKAYDDNECVMCAVVSKV